MDHFTSGSSSSHSSSDHSSSGHSISGHFLSGHTPQDTTDADSSTPPRFVHPSLARTPRCSEAYLRWRSAPLSTIYPPTISESSARDSSSESSAGPSHKRCRSSAATVTSSIHAMRALVPSRADLLPPQDIEADATAVEVAVDRDVEARIDAGIGMELDVGVDVEDEVEDEVESSDREDIKTGHRELESRSLTAGEERASLLEQVASLERSNARLRGTMMMERARADRFRRRVRFMESELRQIRRFRYYYRMRFRRLETFINMTITRSGMTPEAIKELVNRRVEEALAAYEAIRAANALEAESQSQNDSDGDNGNDGNGNGGDGNGGNGNAG
ncbi:hypothetical protein Tco_1233833, partial [Tanacetum coccineum]